MKILIFVSLILAIFALAFPIIVSIGNPHKAI